MGHKTRPDALRLGIIGQWQSRWFNKKKQKEWLEEDYLIRQVINKKIAAAGIVKINIERNSGDIKIVIKVARPGLVIGRGGKGIEELVAAIKKEIGKLYRKRGVSSSLPGVSISVEELKRTEISAQAVAYNAASDLERRLPYRRILKKYLDLMRQNKDVKGAKIQVAGRLNGAEIARTEWLAKGKLPLHTLRADIDYGQATAYTTYGTIGVKVWVYKGEVFNKEHVNS